MLGALTAPHPAGAATGVAVAIGFVIAAALMVAAARTAAWGLPATTSSTAGESAGNGR